MNTQILSNVRQVTLYLLIVMTGLYAGLHFAGVLAPVQNKMSVTEYTFYWQIVDGYMGQRMPIFGMIFLALFALNLLLFIKKWKTTTFWIIIIGLVLLLSDMILTAKQQIPINQYIQSVDAKNLTTHQLTTLGRMKEQAESNFGTRDMLSIVSFALLSLTPFLLSRPRRKDNEADGWDYWVLDGNFEDKWEKENIKSS